MAVAANFVSSQKCLFFSGAFHFKKEYNNKRQFKKMVLDMEMENAKSEAIQLMKRKEQIEDQLKELKEVLDKNHVGMTDSLVDDEGYPRNDVDVYQVRHARHKIICLQNDHKCLMIEIEEKLIKIHGVAGNNGPESLPPPVTTPRAPETPDFEEILLRDPFLRVTAVSEASPAAEAGLRNNDLIMEFGSINSLNFKSMKDIADLVQHSCEKAINVKVKRADDCMILTLIPKTWRGRGLLGCNVVPIESVER